MSKIIYCIFVSMIGLSIAPYTKYSPEAKARKRVKRHETNRDQKQAYFHNLCIQAKLCEATLWIENTAKPGTLTQYTNRLHNPYNPESVVGIVLHNPDPKDPKHQALLDSIQLYCNSWKVGGNIHKQICYILDDRNGQTRAYVPWTRKNFDELIKSDMFNFDSFTIKHFCLSRYSWCLAPLGNTTGINVELGINYNYLEEQFLMTVIRLGFEEKSIEEQLVGFAEYGLINHQNRYSYATVSNSYRPKKKILRLKVDKDDVSSLACTAFLLAQASEEHCLDRENILRGATIKLTGSQSLILIQDFVLKQFNERDIESIQIEVSGV